MKMFKCPICHDEHEIDEYGWVQTCIGYFDLNNIEHKIEKWLEKIFKR